MLLRDLKLTVIVAAITVASAAYAAPQAPVAAQQPRATGANAPTDVQTFGDWTVRCFSVKAQAPCDMLQVALNKKSQQRVMSVSFAYAPSKDAYATQIVVPLGVAVSRGLTLSAGTHKIEGMKFRRCERDGCYVEVVLDKNSVEGLSANANKGSIAVTPYRQDKAVALPISFTGFAASLAKMKDLARVKATMPSAPAPAAAPATTPAH